MTKDTDKITLFITLLGVIIIFILIYFLGEKQRNIPNIATIIGTFGSFIGLAIAYINILELKNINKETEAKIEVTLDKFNQINSIIDISKTLKINQEIQFFLKSNKNELAHLRYVDLKHLLLQFNNNTELQDIISDKQYSKLFKEFNIDLSTINDFIENPTRKFDKIIIINHLEDLATYLTNFEIKLKKLKI